MFACIPEFKVNIFKSSVIFFADTPHAKDDPPNKIILLSLSRLNIEDENKEKSINRVVKFEFVQSSKSKNIDQNNVDLVLELLAIDIFKRDHNFEITLLFSKNRIITLSVEAIEVTLEDQNKKKND